MPPALLGPIEGVGLLGAGCAYPSRTLSNLDVLRHIAPFTWPDRRPDDEQLAFMAQGLVETIGVENRSWAHLVGTPLDPKHEQTTADLAIEAARRALDDAGMPASALSLLLCATSTPHRMTSTLSAAVGAAIGARAACMDTRTGCSGGLFALTTAALYVAAGSGPALIIGAETFSKVIPPASKIAAVSLGDGAAALVVGSRDGARILASFLETDGALGRLITTDGALPPTVEEIARGGYSLSGAPEELAATVPEKYALAIEGALSRAGIRADEIDRFVPHQTSVALIRCVADQARIKLDRTIIQVGAQANIGAAGWMSAYAAAHARGDARPGATFLLAAVGGGMSWGAAVLKC